MAEPNYSIIYNAVVHGADGPFAIGDAMICDESAGKWVRSTLANRTALGGQTEGIALTAFGGHGANVINIQTTGPLARAVSDLGIGLRQAVRVNDDARLERVSSPALDDDLVGTAQISGRVLLSIASGFVSGGAGTPTNSIQAANANGTFRGSARFFVDDDGNITTAEGIPVLVSYAGGNAVAYVGWDGIIADDKQYGVSIGSEKIISLQAGFIDLGGGNFNVATGMVFYGPGSIPALPNAKFIFQTPNVYFGQATGLAPLLTTVDPSRGGVGYQTWQYRATAASGNPPSGHTHLYADETTGHLTQVLPNGTTHDLWSSDDGPILSTSATGTVADLSRTVGSEKARAIEFTGTTSAEWRGIEAPEAGRKCVVTIVVPSGIDLTLTLAHDDAVTAANGFDLPSDTNLVLNEGVYQVSYHHAISRWRVIRDPYA